MRETERECWLESKSKEMRRCQTVLLQAGTFSKSDSISISSFCISQSRLFQGWDWDLDTLLHHS